MEGPQSKTPAGRPGQSEAAQQDLFERPEFSPTWPNNATKAGQLLAALLEGATLNHPEFWAIARTWRLAAYAWRSRPTAWCKSTARTG